MQKSLYQCVLRRLEFCQVSSNTAVKLVLHNIHSYSLLLRFADVRQVTQHELGRFSLSCSTFATENKTANVCSSVGCITNNGIMFCSANG